MISSVLVILPFLVGINAVNDWSVPCVTGQCSYDLPATNGSSSSGTMKIWGSNDAITDITTAADWQILGCNATALSQDIRLVCTNDDPDSQCAHLYQNTGAVNKIVRLPENCGASAFARVSKSWVPDDQSIPASVKARVFRRDGTAPVVKALSLDTNFDAVDWSKNGMVNIAIVGANVPGAPNDIPIPGSRRARFVRRGLSDLLGNIGDGIKGAANDVKSAAESVGDKITSVAGAAATDVKKVATKAATEVKHAATAAATDAKKAATKAESVAKAAATKVATAAKSAASDVKDAAGDVADAAKSALNNTIDVNKTFDLAPITFDKNVNLVNQAVSCGANSLSMQVDMDANANAQVAITVQATGTLAPPKISSFNVVAGMTATVVGTMTMTADVTGHIDSGKIPLVNLGIPGLDFPGILTVGPSFTVSAQVVGDVDVTMDMTVGVNLDVNNAQLTFPPDNSTQGANAFAIGDTPLTLNASPDVQATGTITAHLIPSLNLGVNALGGKASAQIFFALDTNAALTMNLDASGSATKVIGAAPVDNSAAATGDDTTADDATADDGTATDDTTTDDTTTDDTTGDDTTADDTTTDSTTDDSTMDPTLDNSALSDDATDTTDATEDDTTSTDETTADNSETADSEDATTDETTDDTATADDSTDATDATDNSTDTTTDSTDATDDSTGATSTDDSTDASLDPTTLDNSSSTNGTDATADGTTDGTTDDTTATDGTDTTDDTTTDASGTTGSVGGCVQLNAGINVNTGISGSFFNLFNAAKTATLFSKDFLIFNKCFGDQATQAADATATATTRRSVPRLSRLDRQRRAAFACPALGLAKPVSVTKGTVKASSITAKKA
ncbi:hypothetical protein C8R44DRAFT_676083 [Mycena epipterygia]|nr:hypothetical protein C8R44DRAFT_676083 [Mycena epipterygia]